MKVAGLPGSSACLFLSLRLNSYVGLHIVSGQLVAQMYQDVAAVLFLD